MPQIILLGPTATGKTKLAIELAKELNGEIISADSMQVYREMDIGTAKPTREERQGIAHYLIDIRNPDEEWTVSDFIREAEIIQAQIQAQGKQPIIVGGTGLYLWSLLEGFSFPISPADKELRARLEQLPTATLSSQLSRLDPMAANKIHPHDKKRMIRALEVYELTGIPISELQKNRNPEPLICNQLLIGLDLPRTDLYERINERVDSMITKGLIAEVQCLLAKGYSSNLSSFQALGYKEVVAFLSGKFPRAVMIEELKKRTRNFARRQMTWFRRFPTVHWFSPAEKDAIIKLCLDKDNKK